MRRWFAHPAADGYPAMDEDPDGDYVLVEDLQPLVERMERYLTEARMPTNDRHACNELLTLLGINL